MPHLCRFAALPSPESIINFEVPACTNKQVSARLGLGSGALEPQTATDKASSKKISFVVDGISSLTKFLNNLS